MGAPSELKEGFMEQDQRIEIAYIRVIQNMLIMFLEVPFVEEIGHG